MSIVKHDKPWKPFLIKAAVILICVTLFFVWVQGRFLIGIDNQLVRCLPDHKYFLVHLTKPEPVRDEIMAYHSRGLGPIFDDGIMMAKMVRGMPGDHLVINEKGVFINGEFVAEGFPILEQTGLNIEDLYRSETIPDGKYLMLAPAPESYDGRYWGYISKDQFVGQVTPLI